MSTVQLSGAVAERLRARRSAPHRGRSGACRALFGPVDHEELDRDMESKLSEMCARDRHRWNFDFETDTPLYGGYAWEALGVQEMPVFYRECVRRGARSIRVAQREQPRDMVAREERAVHGGCPGTERLADAEEKCECGSGIHVHNAHDRLLREEAETFSGEARCSSRTGHRGKSPAQEDPLNVFALHCVAGKKERWTWMSIELFFSPCTSAGFSEIFRAPSRCQSDVAVGEKTLKDLKFEISVRFGSCASRQC
ncbi:cyclin-dependent kinase inhibitor 1B-like [Arapaima gigas]